MLPSRKSPARSAVSSESPRGGSPARVGDRGFSAERVAARAGSAESAPVRLLRPAAGGSVVAHQEGRTLFVRGGLPGELVTVRVTGRVRGGKVLHAEVLEVLEASPDRVAAPCAVADVCGGCDLQHVAYPAQLEWKSEVLRDQLARIGGIAAVGGVPLSEAVRVEEVPVPGAAPGLRWRTRLGVDTDREGHAGFHRRRGARLVAPDTCPVAVPELEAAFGDHQWPAQRRIDLGLSAQGPVAFSPGGGRPPVPAGWAAARTATREVGGRSYRVAVAGFWQAHVHAPELLSTVVREFAAGLPGERVVDLFSGVGLFACGLADAVGPAGEVHAVEGDSAAARLARRNAHDLPQVALHHANVAAWLAEPPMATVDSVVLDPPRTGAGARVVAAIAALQPARIVYVACDGASLARDARSLAAEGYELCALRAFDLFGMTHHIEAVALFVADDGARRTGGIR